MPATSDFYLINEDLAVQPLNTLVSRSDFWKYARLHLADFDQGAVQGGQNVPELPVSPDGKLQPGVLYPSSTDPNVNYYLPQYQLNTVDGRYTTSLKWRSAQDDPNGPLAFLTVEVFGPAPPTNSALREIPHVALARILYHMPVEDAAPQPQPAGIERFVGNWLNVDPNTRGMTRLEVARVDDRTATFHGYGKCHPDDCDWGLTSATLTAEDALMGVYDFGFKKTTITARWEAGKLSAEVFDDYTEADGRTDRMSHYLMAEPAAGGEQAGQPTLQIEVGALEPAGEKTRRCRRPIATKPEFDRLYQILTEPIYGGRLEIHCFATIGRRTWRQIIPTYVDLELQKRVLTKKELLFTDLVSEKALELGPLGQGDASRPCPVEIAPPDRLSTIEAGRLLSEDLTGAVLAQPPAGVVADADHLHTVVSSRIVDILHDKPFLLGNLAAPPSAMADVPPAADLGGLDVAANIRGLTNLSGERLTLRPGSSLGDMLAKRPASGEEFIRPDTSDVFSDRLGDLAPHEPELHVIDKSGEVLASPPRASLPVEALQTAVNDSLIRHAFARPLADIKEATDLRVRFAGVDQAAAPVRVVLGEQGEPALLSVPVETIESIAPFCFPLETNAYMFDIPGDMRPSTNHILIRMEVLGDTGQVLAVFYQDPAFQGKFYYQPQEFRLPRLDTPPYLPDMWIAFVDLLVQPEGGGENVANLLYQVKVGYRALPYIEPGILELARQQVHDLNPHFSSLVPESSQLSLRLPEDEAGGDLVSTPRASAQVNLELGIVDEIDLSKTEFERVFAFFQQSSGVGLEGMLDALLVGGLRAPIPVRLSLKENAGSVFTHTYKGPQPGGLHRVTLLNRIESPVRVEGLYPVGLGAKVTAFPQTDPGMTVAPGATLDVDYRVSSEKATVADIPPSVSVSIQVDPLKLWPRLFKNPGYTSETFPVTVSIEPGFIGAAPGEGQEPLTGVQVHFEEGPTVKLMAAQTTATVQVPMPMLPRLLGLGQAKQYRYQVTNLHGEQADREGAKSDWLPGEGEAALSVTPAGA